LADDEGTKTVKRSEYSFNRHMEGRRLYCSDMAYPPADGRPSQY